MSSTTVRPFSIHFNWLPFWSWWNPMRRAVVLQSLCKCIEAGYFLLPWQIRIAVSHYPVVYWQNFYRNSGKRMLFGFFKMAAALSLLCLIGSIQAVHISFTSWSVCLLCVPILGNFLPPLLSSLTNACVTFRIVFIVKRVICKIVLVYKTLHGNFLA